MAMAVVAGLEVIAAADRLAPWYNSGVQRVLSHKGIDAHLRESTREEQTTLQEDRTCRRDGRSENIYGLLVLRRC